MAPATGTVHKIARPHLLDEGVGELRLNSCRTSVGKCSARTAVAKAPIRSTAERVIPENAALRSATQPRRSIGPRVRSLCRSPPPASSSVFWCLNAALKTTYLGHRVTKARRRRDDSRASRHDARARSRADSPANRRVIGLVKPSDLKTVSLLRDSVPLWLISSVPPGPCVGLRRGLLRAAGDR
jgi:hypothetical protein